MNSSFIQYGTINNATAKGSFYWRCAGISQGRKGCEMERIHSPLTHSLYIDIAVRTAQNWKKVIQNPEI